MQDDCVGSNLIQIDLIKRRVNLENEKRSIEARLKCINSEIESMNDPIISQMQLANLRNIPLKDGPTICQRRNIFCTKRPEVQIEDACSALEIAGLEWLVAPSYSVSKFKAWIKEQEKERGIQKNGPADLLPENLREMFNVVEKTTVVVLGTKQSKQNGESNA